jgi:glucosyl-dolichyl phosphate glucuronosyltransferase
MRDSTLEKLEISVVIPSYKRADLLELLLDSLLEQTIPREVFEVIVVDNAPLGDASVAELCETAKYAPLNLTYVHHAVPGASQARNRGISLTRAPLVGFADDDHVLPPDWIEKTIGSHRCYPEDIIGGPYQPFYTTPKPAWMRDQYLALSWGAQARRLGEREHLFGGNMAWPAKLLQDVGGFSTAIGRVGVNREYGEETEIQIRAEEAGAGRWFDPQLYNFHHVPPDHMRASWFVRSRWYHGKAKARVFLHDLVKTDERPPYRVAGGWYRSALRHGLSILGRLLVLPFRDRTRYPGYQNYIIEVLCPKVSGFSMCLYIGSHFRRAALIRTGDPLRGAG